MNSIKEQYKVGLEIARLPICLTYGDKMMFYHSDHLIHTKMELEKFYIDSPENIFDRVIVKIPRGSKILKFGLNAVNQNNYDLCLYYLRNVSTMVKNDYDYVGFVIARVWNYFPQSLIGQKYEYVDSLMLPTVEKFDQSIHIFMDVQPN